MSFSRMWHLRTWIIPVSYLRKFLEDIFRWPGYQWKLRIPERGSCSSKVRRSLIYSDQDLKSGAPAGVWPQGQSLALLCFLQHSLSCAPLSSFQRQEMGSLSHILQLSFQRKSYACLMATDNSNGSCSLPLLANNGYTGHSVKKLNQKNYFLKVLSLHKNSMT